VERRYLGRRGERGSATAVYQALVTFKLKWNESTYMGRGGRTTTGYGALLHWFVSQSCPRCVVTRRKPGNPCHTIWWSNSGAARWGSRETSTRRGAGESKT